MYVHMHVHACVHADWDTYKWKHKGAEGMWWLVLGKTVNISPSHQTNSAVSFHRDAILYFYWCWWWWGVSINLAYNVLQVGTSSMFHCKPSTEMLSDLDSNLDIFRRIPSQFRCQLSQEKWRGNPRHDAFIKESLRICPNIIQIAHGEIMHCCMQLMA